MMKERLHDTATGPLRGAARGPCTTPSEPSPATPAPCHAPASAAAAPRGAHGGAAGSSGSGTVAGPGEGDTELVLPAARGAAGGQSSPEHAGGGGREPAAPHVLGAATLAPTGVASPSAAVPGAAGAPAGVAAARAATHGTGGAAAVGGQDSAAAQAGAGAALAAGSPSAGSRKAAPDVQPAAGPGQGWGGNLRAAGGLPKTSRTATLGEIAPPLRKFPRVRSPTVPPARQRAPAAAAQAVEAVAHSLLGQFGAQASVEDVPNEMVPPAYEGAPAAAAEASGASAQQLLGQPGALAPEEGVSGDAGLAARQHAATGAAADTVAGAQPLLGQVGAQAAAEGVPGDVVLPKRQRVVEAAVKDLTGLAMLPECQGGAGAAAAVGAVGAEGSLEDTSLLSRREQCRREMPPAGQPQAEPAAASTVEAPVRQEEGAPTESEAAQAAAVEQQGSASAQGGVQGPSAGLEPPPAGRSGSAPGLAARAAPGAGVVPGSGDLVGFSTGAGAGGRAAPGSGFDACSGRKQGQQGLRPAKAEEAQRGMSPHMQVHLAPHPAPIRLRRDLPPGGSMAGRPSGAPGAPGVLGCAPPMGPGGARRGAAVQPSSGGACGQRSGREPGTVGAGSAPGNREGSFSGAHSAPRVRGTAYSGTHGALGSRRAAPTGTQSALGGRGCAAPAGWHGLNGGCCPRLGPDSRAGLPRGGRPRCEARMPGAGSAPCTAGGPNPGQNPTTHFNSRAWPHPQGVAPQCAVQGRAPGSTPGAQDSAPARRRPAGQHRPGTAPGDAFYNLAEERHGGLAACRDPGAAAAGAERRGIYVSEQLPGPPPSQQLRRHSAPAGGRPRAHPGVQGHAQARPPVAYSRPGTTGAPRTQTEHEGQYPGPGPGPHSGWTRPPPAAQLEQALPTERGAAHRGHQEVGMPRVPCERRDWAAPGAPAVPKQPLHSRSGSQLQSAVCRVPAMEPNPVGHAAATRRSGGACQAEAHAREKPVTRALPAKREGMLMAAPEAGSGAPGADMAAPPAHAPPDNAAKHICSRAGGKGVPAAAVGAAAAPQAGRSSLRAGRAGTAAAAGHALRAQEVKRARVQPHDAGAARVAMGAMPGPRAKRACSRSEAAGSGASPWQNSRRAAGVRGAAPGARGSGREFDQAGEPDQAPPGVSPTIARLVEQVLPWMLAC